MKINHLSNQKLLLISINIYNDFIATYPFFGDVLVVMFRRNIDFTNVKTTVHVSRRRNFVDCSCLCYKITCIPPISGYVIADWFLQDLKIVIH